MMQLSKGHTPGFQYSSAKMTVGAILRSSPTPAAVMDKSATLHSGFSWNNRTASNGLHSNKKKKQRFMLRVLMHTEISPVVTRHRSVDPDIIRFPRPPLQHV
jgi:hypothetical protein